MSEITEQIMHKRYVIDAPGGEIEIDLTYFNEDDGIDIRIANCEKIEVLACDLAPLITALQKVRSEWVKKYGVEAMEALTKQQRESREKEAKP